MKFQETLAAAKVAEEAEVVGLSHEAATASAALAIRPTGKQGSQSLGIDPISPTVVGGLENGGYRMAHSLRKDAKLKGDEDELCHALSGGQPMRTLYSNDDQFDTRRKEPRLLPHASANADQKLKTVKDRLSVSDFALLPNECKLDTALVQVSPKTATRSTCSVPSKRPRSTEEDSDHESYPHGPHSEMHRTRLRTGSGDGHVKNESSTRVLSKPSVFSLRPARKHSAATLSSAATRKKSVAPTPANWRGNLQKLRYLKTLLRVYERSLQTYESIDVLQEKLGDIRRHLNKMEFFDFLSANILHQSSILGDDGLGHVVADKGRIFPPDIRDDAYRLLRRWKLGRFETDLLAGITTVLGEHGAHRTQDRSYVFSATSQYIGSGMLVVGDWWPFQICCVRDGAHGEMEAGISGDFVNGAFSIVMSGCKYENDVDDGDRIEYCGTKGNGNDESAGTKQLLLSHANNNSIRVLRSHSLPKENKYRPVKGIRYDGLYKIVDYTIIDVSTLMYRFTMVRNEGQTPIRFGGTERRPTPNEVAEYDKIRYRVT